jgi:hypothetical protein
MSFSSALVTDENVAYFRGLVNIFVGRPTKIRKLFSSASTQTKMLCIFVGLSPADEHTSFIFVGLSPVDENKRLTPLFSSASVRPTKIEAVNRTSRPHRTFSLSRSSILASAAARSRRAAPRHAKPPPHAAPTPSSRPTSWPPPPLPRPRHTEPRATRRATPSRLPMSRPLRAAVPRRGPLHRCHGNGFT